MHHRHMPMNGGNAATTSPMASTATVKVSLTTTTTTSTATTITATTITTDNKNSTSLAAAPTTTTTTTPSACNVTSSSTGLHQRRRKKRPNYGTRTVEVRRGYNGFGFTISGQQPCRLSCIVAESPADQAGLRNGDFLISINGLNVSKLPHETVVQLIGNSFGSIRMQIAENYYSDSSDEENAAALAAGSTNALQRQHHHQHNQHHPQQQQHNLNNVINWRGAKPRYLQHRTKLQRMRNSPHKKRSSHQQPIQQQQQENHEELALNAVSACAAAAALEIQTLRPLIEDMPLSMRSSNKNNANTSITSSSDVANVSAMVRVPTAALEYRTIVGYMGTIEMPKQISHSSKLQTVRSCIRKLRQEKRQPTTVLMIILPDSLRLQSINGSILASYSSSRLNYVSSSSESENRFFGLITSAVHTTHADDKNEHMCAEYEDNDDDDDDIESAPHQKQHLENDLMNPSTANISISNSCHVFVVDTKLCEHTQHITRANEFRIQCTRDPITSLCLEFPNNSEYVVNLIRSMYTMRILPPATRQNSVKSNQLDDLAAMGAAGVAHSPQPSNHSEISTTTSNSDSGIGFHNETNNISDRIVVVDFPGVPELRIRNSAAAANGAHARPARIFNNFNNFDNSNNNNKEKRLTVRAMPDPKTPKTTLTRPNLLASFSLIKSPATSLTATRSCDDVLALMERCFDNNMKGNDTNEEYDDDDDDENNYGLYGSSAQQQHMPMTHASMDDISLHSTATASTAALVDDHNDYFLHPSCMNNHKYITTQLPRPNNYTPNKLSPQVYCSPSKLIKHDNNNSHAMNNVIAKNSNQNENDNEARTTRSPTRTNVKKAKLRFSLGFEAFDESSKRAPQLPLTFDMDTWSSLQNINGSPTKPTLLDITNSEPELVVSALKVELFNSYPMQGLTEDFSLFRIYL